MASNHSLSLVAASSQFLSKTFAGAGNQQKWTWAAWVKLAAAGTRYGLFSGGDAGGLWEIEHQANNTIAMFSGSGGTSVDVESSTTIADTSWHHVCVAVDTTQATAANRVHFYIDGTEVSYAVTTYPAQNVSGLINSAKPHNLGRQVSPGSTINFDGLMTDVYFVDGLQLTPSSFTTGTGASCRQIDPPFSGTFGTNGVYLQFANSGALGTDTSGKGNTWTNNATATQNATWPPAAWLIAVSVAAFVLTGIAAALSKSKILIAATASFVLTGIAVRFPNYFLAAARATYTLTGIAATFARGIKMVASRATFVLTGIAAIVRKSLKLTASPASFTLTGMALIESVQASGQRVIRGSQFVLQKLRTTSPTLDQ